MEEVRASAAQLPGEERLGLSLCVTNNLPGKKPFEVFNNFRVKSFQFHNSLSGENYISHLLFVSWLKIINFSSLVYFTRCDGHCIPHDWVDDGSYFK